MARQKDFPEKVDQAGNLQKQFGLRDGNDQDYSGLGIDGKERTVDTSDPFCQWPGYEFDEFH